MQYTDLDLPWTWIPEQSPCPHQWKKTLGLYRVYYDCELCGVKREEVEGGEV